MATRIKTEAVRWVPQTRDEAVEAVALYGRLRRELTRVETEMNDALAGIKAQYEGLAAPLHARAKATHAGLQIWCEANRDALTEGAKVKTVALGAGEVRWRLPPPSVKISRSKGALARIIKTLRDRGLERFVRVSEDISKEAILAEPAAVRGIAGIDVVQEETFEVVPFEVGLSEAA